MKRISFVYFFIILINTSPLHGLTIIQGDATTTPYQFTSPITTTALQKSTGSFFVGVANPTNPLFSIAKAIRPTFVTTPKFIGIATDLHVQGSDIEFLVVSDQLNTSNTVVTFVMSGTTNFQSQQVAAIFDNGSSFVQTTTLNDALGDETAGIVQLATSMARTTTYVNPAAKNVTNLFAAVRPNTGNFGDVDSGIALMNLSSTSAGIRINTINAQTGQPGNTAQFLDAFSPELKGTSGGGDVVFSTDPEDVNQVALYYDNVFGRLYTGVRIATDATIGDIGKSVVVGHVDSDNALTLEPITPDSTIDPTLDQIVLTQNTANQAGPSLRANRLSVMHTSAGPSYLIVQGGDGQTDEVGNLIFALPLVDKPKNQTIHGTLANKNAPLTDFKFTIPATDPDDLVTATDPAAQIGGTPLPMLPSDQISNMVVVGDAVFVSISLEPSNTNDNGILYSQALFDASGKIINWTPWVKRASSSNLFPQINEQISGVDFFDVDASTGNIFVISQTDEFGDVAGVTTWTEQISTYTTSLINQLNPALLEGSYAVLDLPQSVRGFTADLADQTTRDRYALFGGVNKIVFARISESVDQGTTGSQLDTPQTVITDFTDPENFLVTFLPTAGGYIQALEYSRRTFDEGNSNYFFAGTEDGLFVFTSTQNQGFNVNELSTLNQEPFIHGHWQKISEIEGSVVDIKTSGQALYILTFQTSAEVPLKNTLYKVSFEDSLEEMFDGFMNVRILAQTKTAPVFNTTQLFTGIQIISTGTPPDFVTNKEQLIIATNQGLFKSNANQGNANRGIADADTQFEADWELVQTTTDTMYTGISGIETPIRHTTWPISVQDNNDCRSFDASSIQQLNSNGDSNTGEVGFAPLFFNADEETPTSKTFDPINYFFSDGGRRFFIFNPTSTSGTQTKLGVIPFDTQAWHAQTPQILKYSTLKGIQRFFWVQTIGMSGLVLAGTNHGIVGLT